MIKRSGLIRLAGELALTVLMCAAAFTACVPENGRDAVSRALGIDVSGCALLPECGRGGEVVVLQRGGPLAAGVFAEGPIGGCGVENADGTPLERGSGIIFSMRDVGFPMTLTAYGGPGSRLSLASAVIADPPPAGERRYLTLEFGDR